MDSGMWDKLESTPYGRMGKVQRPTNAPAYALFNRVSYDQWNVESGMDVLNKEMPLGKRCFVPRTSIAGVLDQGA